MQQQILQFATTNPWSTFFTVTTVIYAVNYAIKALLNEQVSRGIIIMVLLVGFLWCLSSFFGIPQLTTWVDQNSLIYLLILLGVDSVIAGCYKYNNPKVTEDE
jgi:hypothetical protein